MDVNDFYYMLNSIGFLKIYPDLQEAQIINLIRIIDTFYDGKQLKIKALADRISAVSDVQPLKWNDSNEIEFVWKDKSTTKCF